MEAERGVEHMRRGFERARSRYPTVELSYESYRARLTEIAADRSRSGAAVDPVGPHYEDIYLALACASGDRIAWEYFADEYLPLLKEYAVRACQNLDEGEDMAQEIVARLMGNPASPGAPVPPGSQLGGKMRSYAGRGSLGGWLRVMVANAAIDSIRRKRKQSSLDELLEGGVDPTAGLSRRMAADEPDPGESRWREVISALLKQAISDLPARDRLMLVLYYAQGVPLKLIGRQFGMHEATISRRLERLRRELRRTVERECQGRHGLRDSEVRQIMLSMPAGGGTELGLLRGASGNPRTGGAAKVQD